MYSWSSFCIRNGTQARPDSIQTTGSLGKRSPMPLMTQFDRLTMLYQEKPSACAVRKRLQLLKIGSPPFGPEWNDSTRPRSSIARYNFIKRLALTARLLRTVVTMKPPTPFLSPKVSTWRRQASGSENGSVSIEKKRPPDSGSTFSVSQRL